MSKFRLRSYELAPPGGYPYIQQNGIRREFPSQPLIEAQARIVSDFRKANGLSRPSVREALEDIDAQTCQRLGNMPQFCIPCNQPAGQAQVVALSNSSPIVAPPCAGCGAPVQ